MALGGGVGNQDPETSDSSETAIIGSNEIKTTSNKEIGEKLGLLVGKTSQNKEFALCSAYGVSPNLLQTAGHCAKQLKTAAKNTRFVYRTASGKETELKLESAIVDEESDTGTVATQRKVQFLEKSGFDPKNEVQIYSVASDTQQIQISKGKASLLASSSGIVTYNIDTTSGFSGSPILQNGKVIGTHIGSSKIDGVVTNIGITDTKTANLEKAKVWVLPEQTMQSACYMVAHSEGRDGSECESSGGANPLQRLINAGGDRARAIGGGDPYCFAVVAAKSDGYSTYDAIVMGLRFKKDELRFVGIHDENTCRTNASIAVLAGQSYVTGVSLTEIISASASGSPVGFVLLGNVIYYQELAKCACNEVF